MEPNLWNHYHFNQFPFKCGGWLGSPPMLWTVILNYESYHTESVLTPEPHDYAWGHGETQMGLVFSYQGTCWGLRRASLFSEIGVPTYRLQGHSPEGYKILSLLVSAEGHRDCLGTCHRTGSALRGPGSRPGSSWSTAWWQRERGRFSAVH